MKNKKRFRILFLTLLTLMLSTCFIYGISENDTDNNNLPLKIRLVSGPTDRIVGREDNIKYVAPGTEFILDVVDEQGNIIDAKKLNYELVDIYSDTAKESISLIYQKEDKSKNIPAHYSFKFKIPYHNLSYTTTFKFCMKNDESTKGKDSFQITTKGFDNLIPESMQLFIVKGNEKVETSYIKYFRPLRGEYKLRSIDDNRIVGFKYNGKLLKPGQVLTLDLFKQYVVEPAYADPAKNTQVSKPAIGWKQTEIGRWWYESSEIPFEYYNNVTKTFGDNTYRFDQSGWMKTGWYYEGGTWYYHNKKGEGVEGARVKNSWKKIGGKWYYFYKDGKMAKNTKIGSSYVDKSGAWIQDKWVKSGSRYWYSLAGGGYVKNAYKYISGKYYYFDNSGWMKTGWVKYNGQWYYHNKKGEGVEGAMASNEWKKVGSSWYYFGNGGRMATGWNRVGSSWYYHNRKGEGTEGVMVSGGWKKIGSKYYYFYGSGRMAANTYVGGYYVNKSGVWVR